MKISSIGTRVLHSVSNSNIKENNPPESGNTQTASKRAVATIYINQAQILKTNYANSMFISEIKKSQNEGLTEFETAAVNSAKTLEKYKSKGIPLKYSRKDFIKNLNKILKNESQENKEKIYSKLKITKAISEDGYNGILTLGNLDENNPVEKQILKEGYKFLFQNEAKTGDKETDEFINNIINGMPEFINIIGKQQHKNHNYSVDIHSLMVLSNIISDPDYQTLSDEGKFVLKMTSLLHDIGKDEFVPDPMHPFKSLELSKPVVKKYKLENDVQTRVLNSIKNHQWLQWYNTSGSSKEVAKMLVEDYKSKEDYQMALIIAHADLKATSAHINALYSNCLEETPQTTMREAVDKKFQD